MSLTNSQVEQFLEIKLGFKDWESKLSGDKLNFLRELMARHVSTRYYENITWGAKKLNELQTPTVAEVIEHGTGTAGGACVHLNYFMKLLLEKLGFDVFVAAGEVPFLNIPRNHMVTIVRLPVPVPVSVNIEEDTASTPTPNKNVKGGDGMKMSDEEFELYLIDVGFGRPIVEPISLNKASLPYKGKAAGFSFEVRYNSDTNRYERYLKGGCPIKGKFENETDELVAYFFDLIPLKFEDFDDGYRRIFTDPTESFFLNTWFLFRFITLDTSPINNNNNNSSENVSGNNNCAHFDYKYVSCRGKSICFGTVNDREEIKYETYTEMIPVVQKWFPNLNQDTVRLAVSRYQISPELNLSIVEFNPTLLIWSSQKYILENEIPKAEGKFTISSFTSQTAIRSQVINIKNDPSGNANSRSNWKKLENYFTSKTLNTAITVYRVASFTKLSLLSSSQATHFKSEFSRKIWKSSCGISNLGSSCS